MTELRNQVKINVLNSKVVSSPFANGYCKRYYLELNHNGKKYRFTYHDSVHAYCNGSKLDKLNALYCILMDSNSIEYTRDFSDFCSEFGYNEYDYTCSYFPYRYIRKENKEAKKVYNACMKTYEALHDIFSNDELEQLQDEFQDY